MKKAYIKTGTCIFCGKSYPAVSFYTKPHVLPKSMGGDIIGVDICDKCNKYFGNPDKLSKYPIPCSIEACVKEIFNLSRLLLESNSKEYIGKRIKSIFFNYYHTQKTIKIKPAFRFNTLWRQNYARQFARGLGELFLQSYHINNNALDPKFDNLRNFVRYNIGNMPVYYFVNRGIYLTQCDMSHPTFNFPPSQIEDINNYGFYSVMLHGHRFLMEVTPCAASYRETYIDNQRKELHVGGFVYENLVELTDIIQVDFTLRSLFANKH